MRTLFVDPGSLRSELALEANTTVPDGLGGHAESWAEIATVFARIEPVSATSIFGADQTVETVTHRVTMRWRSGVGERHALREAGQDFRHSDGSRSGRYRPLSRLPREGGRAVKLAMQLTLDGMIRAMRLKVHALAEDYEEAQRRAAMRNETALTLLASESRRLALEAGDEFGR